MTSQGEFRACPWTMSIEKERTMAGRRQPGSLGLPGTTAHFRAPATYTLGTGLSIPGTTNGASTPGGDDGPNWLETFDHAMARDLVHDFGERLGPGAFTALDRRTVVEGLLERINNPGLIKQGPTQFCGPGSFIFSIATDEPLEYARFAIDLFEYGKGSLKKLHVEPDEEVLASHPPSHGVAQVDWMVLASLRDSENWFFDVETGQSIIRSGTNPHEIAGWFRQAGYTKVVDEANLVFSKDEANAEQASTYFENGYKVVLFVGMGAFDPSRGGKHFVALTSKINLHPTVSLDIFTWGEGRYHLPQSGTLSLKQFLDNYYGYIAAKL
jgi:hypothetical protein